LIINQTGTPESVPPKLYGGTERVISWLTEELVSLGHEVTLFASGDSRISADLVPVWPRGLRLGRPKTDPAIPQAALLEAIADRASEFDVIHCHTDWLQLPVLTRQSVPFVTTTHNRLDLPGLSNLVSQDLGQPAGPVARSPLARHGLSWLAH
jgi:glycosyltransferase involved in cell wall biosynthesis